MTRHLGWHSAAVLVGLGAAALLVIGFAAAFPVITKVIEYWNTERV